MAHLLVFGPGYTASHIMAAAQARGFTAETITRAGFTNDDAVLAAIGRATHILSSVPPDGDQDPVLARYGLAVAACRAEWIGYLSSTGVYGDTAGAWVDESAPTGAGRRTARSAADSGWAALHPEIRVFRLPGIYGPGRSPLDRVAAGTAHRIDLPGQVFSRIHVDDIAGGVMASIDRGPPGIYNVADDRPASQNSVIETACALLSLPLPPLRTPDEAGLSLAARAFYSENRRVANGKMKRLLHWQPIYPDHEAGLRALSATTSPARASSDPAMAEPDQR
ncbi:epimerase [Sphingomonas sp. SRS2]|uniref:epimerase n=1 Tax=Sphingomonas sp. SRS2 TaxID=133190 RepID=UPI000618439E|nr:epimerase [Sphingomonas sp. SRS2]KKC26467.1 epimerase [Sphingomonas sp. SRS2]